MMGNVEHPERWHQHRVGDPFGHWHRGPFWLRNRGNGPLRRDPDDRLVGGVAAGVAAWKGLNVTAVRIVFVLTALVSGGFGGAVYVAAWLLIPAAGQETSIASQARNDCAGHRGWPSRWPRCWP